MRKLFVLLLFFVVTLHIPAYGFVPLSAPSAILTDGTSGRTLFSLNEHARMYPAGLTKMLTAIVALEYLNPEDIVVVGPEIHTVPQGAIMSGHQVGEHITVHNLLRGLMIRNGNDSGAVVALQTVQAQRNRQNIPYDAAEQEFVRMMNVRARELGALNTNFVNPNGIHHDNHYTTAYDLAIIARAFMAHPLLSEIAAETEFRGNSLGDLYIEGARTVNHNWVDTNELISGNTFHYPYAVGIRSGSTPQSLDSLAAAARRRDVNLIAIVLSSPDPGRWQDARILFDYGFSTYDYFHMLEEGQLMETVRVTNAKLGEVDVIDVMATESFYRLMSQTQIARLERHLIFNNEFYDEEGNVDYSLLFAPIEMGDVVGSVIFSLDGEVIFESDVIASGSVMERTLDSDMDFYIALIQENIFTVRALPFWMGSAGILIGTLGVSFAVVERRRSKRSWYGRR